LYPRLSNSKATFVADSLRYFDDLTIFRLGTGLLKIPLNGFHGELLVSKGCYLKDITFDRCSITEDYAYASELARRGIKVWQSETKVCILSPNTISDLIKQRNRWFRGISKDVYKAPLCVKLFSGIRLIDWKIGFIGSWFVFPLWFFLELPIWLTAFNLIGAAYYYLAYISGALRLKETKDKVIYILLIPFYSLLETSAPWYKSKTNGFNVIDKNHSKSEVNFVTEKIFNLHDGHPTKVG